MQGVKSLLDSLIVPHTTIQMAILTSIPNRKSLIKVDENNNRDRTQMDTIYQTNIVQDMRVAFR